MRHAREGFTRRTASTRALRSSIQSLSSKSWTTRSQANGRSSPFQALETAKVIGRFKHIIALSGSGKGQSDWTIYEHYRHFRFSKKPKRLDDSCTLSLFQAPERSKLVLFCQRPQKPYHDAKCHRATLNRETPVGIPWKAQSETERPQASESKESVT